MLESLIIGSIQGITEWLPVSSSGVIVLIKKNILHSGLDIATLSQQNLFLHLGTFFAALVYLRQDVARLCKRLRAFSEAPPEDRQIILFLLSVTVISGFLGAIFIKLLASAEGHWDVTGKFVTAVVGIFLLMTGFMELTAKPGGYKRETDIRLWDMILLGVAQGFAALPGISRSGITVSTLLLRKFDKSMSLRLSFLMSLPIVLAGNLLLHLSDITFSLEALTGLLSAFIFGLLSMHALIRFAQKVNFGYFMLCFGLLTIVSLFL
jgi:undecaprenyl-diphosphatase